METDFLKRHRSLTDLDLTGIVGWMTPRTGIGCPGSSQGKISEPISQEVAQAITAAGGSCAEGLPEGFDWEAWAGELNEKRAQGY